MYKYNPITHYFSRMLLHNTQSSYKKLSLSTSFYKFVAYKVRFFTIDRSTDDDTMTLGHEQNERALALIASNSY